MCYANDIPESTLRSWNNKLLLDGNWLPLHIRTLASDNQFSQSEEIVIAEMMWNVIEQKNIPLNNDTHTIKEGDKINFEVQFNASTH